MHTQIIRFSNGRHALAVTAPANSSPKEILHTLGIQQPQTLILLIGAATLPASMIPQLTHFIVQGIAPTALSVQAMIIDGGTEAGIMAMLGKSLADLKNRSLVLGIAPAGLSTYPGGLVKERAGKTAPLDSHHTHFVLVPGNRWGGETDTMFALAQALSQGIPTIVILLNGGLIARKEALQAVRHNWPLLVIEGSGRLADDIAHLWKQRPEAIPNKEMREIITKGHISLFPLHNSPSEFQHHFAQLLKKTR